MLLAPEPGIQRRVQMALGRHGILVAAAASPSDARRLVELERPAALVVDARRADVRSFATSQPGGGPALFGLIDPSDGDAAIALLESGAAEIVSITLIEALLMHRLRGALGCHRYQLSQQHPVPLRVFPALIGLNDLCRPVRWRHPCAQQALCVVLQASQALHDLKKA